MDGKIENKGKDQGKFFWRKRWYSYCSRHQIYNKECDICQHGSWVNVWGNHIGGWVYDIAPLFWIWWVNFPKHKLKFKKLKDLHEKF
jgi:hypothetical protein